MNVDKDLFASYAFYAGICVLKTLGMAALTVRQRLSNKNCISAEDAALNPGSRVGVGLVEDVERVRRAHLNDMENIFPFLTLGFLYIFTGPALSTATTLFRVSRNADIAMYNAKAAGKARFVLFKPHMQEQLHDRLLLEQDIDRGLARGEFFVEFQPVVDLTHRELLGVEALVRWNHPQRGMSTQSVGRHMRQRLFESAVFLCWQRLEWRSCRIAFQPS